MPAKPSSPAIPLPGSWTSRVKSAILHAISLAQFALAHSRGWAADSANARVRLKAENDGLRQELALAREETRIALGWYNAHRPHMSLGGKTPDEVYFRKRPANRSPRFEPRPGWPHGSPCATPWALIQGKPGANIELKVAFQGQRRHLPIVRLIHAA